MASYEGVGWGFKSHFNLKFNSSIFINRNDERLELLKRKTPPLEGLREALKRLILLKFCPVFVPGIISSHCSAIIYRSKSVQ